MPIFDTTKTFIGTKDAEKILNFVQNSKLSRKARREIILALIRTINSCNKQVKAAVLLGSQLKDAFVYNYAKQLVEYNPYCAGHNFGRFLKEYFYDIFSVTDINCALCLGDLLELIYACGDSSVGHYITKIYKKLPENHSSPITQVLRSRGCKVYQFSESEAKNLFFTLEDLRDRVNLIGNNYDKGLLYYYRALYTRQYYTKGLDKLELISNDNSSELFARALELDFTYAKYANRFGEWSDVSATQSLHTDTQPYYSLEYLAEDMW